MVRDEENGEAGRPEAGIPVDHELDMDRFLNSRDAETDVHKW
ncbi:hypothetical protein AB0D84_23015 [Streptomyces sp. NPDC048193]